MFNKWSMLLLHSDFNLSRG